MSDIIIVGDVHVFLVHWDLNKIVRLLIKYENVYEESHKPRQYKGGSIYLHKYFMFLFL